MENLKLNLREGSTFLWRIALHYQSVITMKFREVVDDRHAGILLKVNEVSLAFPYVKSAANFNGRHYITLNEGFSELQGASLQQSDSGMPWN